MAQRNDDQGSRQGGRDHDRGNDRQWRQQLPESRFAPEAQRTDRDERGRYSVDDRDQRSQERPFERPREVPLSEILRDLRGRYGGQHLDAQRSGGTYIITWLSRDGRRMVVVVDAATGRVISVR